MNTKNGGAYDQAAVRRSFKTIRDPSPLLEAMLEWFEGLEEDEQYEVVQGVQQIIFRMRYVTSQSFGPAAALELMGCLIAVECGWISATSLPHRTHVLYAHNGHRGR